MRKTVPKHILPCFVPAFSFCLYSIWILKEYFINLEEIEQSSFPREPRGDFVVVQKPDSAEFKAVLETVEEDQSRTSNLSRFLFPELSPRINERVERTLSQITRNEDDRVKRTILKARPVRRVVEEELPYETISLYRRKLPQPKRNKSTTTSKSDMLTSLYSLNRSSLIFPTTSEQQSATFQSDSGGNSLTPATSRNNEQNEIFLSDCDLTSNQEKSFSNPIITNRTPTYQNH